MKKKKPELIEGKFGGKIYFDELEFSEIYTEEVKPCNATSGRIYLPPKLVGKLVYVLIKSEKKKK